MTIRKSLVLLLFLSSVFIVQAQMKFAFVDTKYVLENMPEYSEAQGELDAASAQWQTEIEERYSTIERMYKSYQAEAVLLTEEMRQKREEEIVRMESEAKNLQKQRFGVEGDLFRKRQELIQPIQEKIFNAIREYANEGGYEAIFDKSGSAGVLYANPKYDKSDKVLRKMGIRPGENKKSSSGNSAKDQGSSRPTDTKGSSPSRGGK
ncbi:MAG: OmpH family outer membrane protein [Flavobacteriales bacterium]|nr:OmpH family outer membrane protein [Flavobacteriales bacterium]NNK80466.1 OmpH family outer membrane protein [Flavobacteriales bacterium]